MIRLHGEYIEKRDGIIEEPVAQTAESELRFALDDINGLRISGPLQASRDALGDTCFLFIDLLENSERREAMMETFEGVRDTALQEVGVDRVAVRVVDADKLQAAVDYYFRARALFVGPAAERGMDENSLDTSITLPLI